MAEADFYPDAMFGPEGMPVIADDGTEQLIPPESLWEWQQDAKDSITPEQWEALQGDVYDTSN